MRDRYPSQIGLPDELGKYGWLRRNLGLDRLRVQPRWLPIAALVGLLSAAMPEIHTRFVGPEVVAAAVARKMDEQLNVRLTSTSRQQLLESIQHKPVFVFGFLRVVGAFGLILVTGMVINVVALLVGAELTAAHGLVIATLSSAAMLAMRIVGWTAIALFGRIEMLAVDDWTTVSDVGVVSFVFIPSQVVRALLSAMEVPTVVGAVVAFLTFRGMFPQSGRVKAGLTGCSGVAVLAGYRVAAALVRTFGLG